MSGAVVRRHIEAAHVCHSEFALWRTRNLRSMVEWSLHARGILSRLRIEIPRRPSRRTPRNDTQWPALILGAVWLLLSASLLADDWPMYKRDAHRSSATDENLTFPMSPAWVYRSVQPPRPAWPEPVKVLNRLDFDYAFHPVIAEGLVCFGSSADDTVRALDAATGAERWHFTTGGPIRFAPQIAGGRAYLASDDGFVYCLAADTGRMVWRFRAAPQDERLLGNERMISRWPVRTGVLADGGAVYCTAGMWSSEGVYVYALDARTGEVIWCNDTSHIVGDVRTLHMGQDFAPYGVCPQGALLAADDILLVPTGKGLPAAYDRKTGKLLYYRMEATYNQRGGTWVTIDGDRFYTTPFVWSLRLADGAAPKWVGGKLVPAYATRIPGTSFSAYDKVSAVVHGGKVYARKAFGLALAGGTLIEGLDGAVTASSAGTQQELWRAEVEGRAREISIAGGRLFVATDRGLLYCFVAGGAQAPARPTVHNPAAAMSGSPAPVPGSLAATVLSELHDARIDRGYALVLGDADGRCSEAIAASSGLHVVSALADETTAAALRERLLQTTALYGSRIEVQAAPHMESLPFASYFANAVVVAGPAAGLSGRELYRVLRPCGGVLLMAGGEAAKLAEQTGAPAQERSEARGFLRVVRGRLPGALDWDSDFALDQRVRWPLRLLWFGGPGPALVMDRKQFTSFGPAANGRYFVFGQSVVTAVDAYNGCMLWTRPVPGFAADLRLVDGRYPAADADRIVQKNYGRVLNADGDSVYLTLTGYFRGEKPERACIRMAADTGAQQAIYGRYTPPEPVSLGAARTWPLEIDPDHSGTLTMAKDADGLIIRLASRDPVATPLDRWDLFFDVRPEPARYGLYDRGAFEVKVFPAAGEKANATWAAGTGPELPRIEVSGTRAGGATDTTVRLPWSELRRLAGGELHSFDFAAQLHSNDGGKDEPVGRGYLFCDFVADGLNNGWARVALDEGGPGVAPAGAPAIFAGAIEAMPKLRPVRWGNAPAAGGQSPFAAVRLHPLTGEPESKLFQGGTFGCGGASYSARCVIKRSTAIGIYDFADDSGMRTFDGVKPGCAVTTAAALGLLIASEGRGGCECTTNFQTSLALAPAETRRNEDWALFYDLDPESLIRQAALNMGAPGDRRAEDGTLWLGYPRIPGGIGNPQAPPSATALGLGQRAVAGNLRVPLEIEGFEAAGPQRVNADRTPIAGTDRPWIYSSCYKGIRKATMKLDFVRPLTSAPTKRPVKADGVLDEGEWPAEPQSVLPASTTRIFVSHDDDNLYLAATRPAVIDRIGKAVPWNKRAAEPDSFRDKDEACEVFLSDGRAERVAHLAVLVSGARYDALSVGPAARKEDTAWNGAWQGGAVADDKGFTVEMAVPWRTLTEAGLDKATLHVNIMSSGPFRTTEALRVLGCLGRERCQNFVPLRLGPAGVVPPAPRRFTVRLHFAELDDVRPGQRVFSVKIQGGVVLKDFDAVKAAGGVRRAVAKEFQHVIAGDALVFEFVPAREPVTPDTAPIISGIEVVAE